MNLIPLCLNFLKLTSEKQEILKDKNLLISSKKCIILIVIKLNEHIQNQSNHLESEKIQKLLKVRSEYEGFFIDCYQRFGLVPSKPEETNDVITPNNQFGFYNRNVYLNFLIMTKSIKIFFEEGLEKIKSLFLKYLFYPLQIDKADLRLKVDVMKIHFIKEVCLYSDAIKITPNLIIYSLENLFLNCYFRLSANIDDDYFSTIHLIIYKFPGDYLRDFFANNCFLSILIDFFKEKSIQVKMWILKIWHLMYVEQKLFTCDFIRFEIESKLILELLENSLDNYNSNFDDLSKQICFEIKSHLNSI